MQLGKQALGHLRAVARIGQRLDQCVDVHVIAVGLFLQQLVFTAQGFESATQIHGQPAVLLQGIADEIVIAWVHIQFAQYCPVLAIMLALVIPFVIEEGTFFVVGPFPHIIGTGLVDFAGVVHTIARGLQIVFGDLAKVLENGCHGALDVVGYIQRPAIEFNFVSKTIRRFL